MEQLQEQQEQQELCAQTEAEHQRQTHFLEIAQRRGTTLEQPAAGQIARQRRRLEGFEDDAPEVPDVGHQASQTQQQIERYKVAANEAKHASDQAQQDKRTLEILIPALRTSIATGRGAAASRNRDGSGPAEDA
ncbi:MAG: hypothetical protein M1838_000567 [Thelocarpon superellum]|nr:MAG: hypothetical protein M1838_000567 [Thelocarpon superellum]